MKKFALLTVMLFSIACLHISCKETPPEPPPQPATLTLKAEDASSTEAWLKATTTETPVTVRLLRDSQRVSDLRLLPAPTQTGTSDSLLFFPAVTATCIDRAP